MPGVVVHQPRAGFRYGAEAFWLAGFALEPGVVDRALDLGTGSGIVALLLAAVGIDAVGCDVRSEWATGWTRTLAESTTPGSVRLVAGDVAAGSTGSYALVVSNPPFFPRGSGPVAPDPFKAAARTEGDATLADFVRTGLGALTPDGRLCVVVPVDRAEAVWAAARTEGAHIHRQAQVGRRRALLELRPGAGEPPEVAKLREDDARVRGWYARFGAR